MTSVYGYQPYGHPGVNAAYAAATAPNAAAYQPVYNAPVLPAQPYYAPSYQAPVPAAAAHNGFYQPQQAAMQAPAPVQQEQEQPVTGGVSSVLDYDLNIMTKYTTYLAFKLFSRNDTDNSSFINSLKSVLSAVRLPLSSLILANYYLLQKYEKNALFFAQSSDDSIYQTVILSLVLANKSNDDNTFTNKSWSDATGLNVRLINSLEANWLSLLSWRLHDTDMARYNELYTQFNKYTQNVNEHQYQLQQQEAQQKAAAAAAVQQQQQQQQQQSYSPIYNRDAYREPISPLLSDDSDYSPSYESRYRAQHSRHQSSWCNNLNNYDYQSAGFEPYHYGPSRHQKSFSLQLEPEYCSRTGSYIKNAYCSCRFCSSPSSGVDWSYNLAAAC